MALTKIWILKTKLVSFVRGAKTVDRERGEQRKRREEEEEKIKRYGCFDFSLELYGFVWISCLDICLWIVGCRKPNPRMNYVWTSLCFSRVLL